MNLFHVKKGDHVKVIADRDKGKTGETIAVDPRAQKVTVEDVNVVRRHKCGSQGTNERHIGGGIISFEAPIHVSDIQLVTKIDGKEVVIRINYQRVDVTEGCSDGSKYQAQCSVRIIQKTGKGI